MTCDEGLEKVWLQMSDMPNLCLGKMTPKVGVDPLRGADMPMSQEGKLSGSIGSHPGAPRAGVGPGEDSISTGQERSGLGPSLWEGLSS